MQIASGLLQPTAGSVTVDGTRVAAQNGWKPFRKRIGCVFQFPEKQLFEETVFDDVAFGILKYYTNGTRVEKTVHGALDRIGLPHERYAARSPHRLSSGEKRKAALAGIIAMNPEILFLGRTDDRYRLRGYAGDRIVARGI